MLQRDLHRTSRWHKAVTFFITSGPSTPTVGETSFQVTWECNEVCSGQIEYGLTSAYGSTTTEQDISGGYSLHAQVISGLTANTTYHYRVKSTNASGKTIYSDDQVIQTDDTISPTTDIGPRYSFYGETPKSLPTYPTGGNVVVVDSSVPTDGTDCSSELANFITSQSDGTTIILDKTDGGDGTVYTLIGDRIDCNTSSGTLKSNITIFGYNAKVVQTSLDVPQCNGFRFKFGGWANLTLQGFWFQGPNPGGGTWACYYPETGISQHAHGVNTFGVQDFVMEDVRISDVGGDYIKLDYPTSTYPRSFYYGGFSTWGPHTIRYCEFRDGGRQGIVPNDTTQLDLHHTTFTDCGLSPFDIEDNTSGMGYIHNVTIADCIFNRWNWHLSTIEAEGNVGGWAPTAVTFQCTDAELATQRDIIIERCQFLGGPQGWGNSTAEIEVMGAVESSNSDYWNTCRIGWAYQSSAQPTTNFTFRDNTIRLDPVVSKTRSSGSYDARGAFFYGRYITNATITGNDCNGHGFILQDCDGTITIENNTDVGEVLQI